jgi:hypothetical protein
VYRKDVQERDSHEREHHEGVPSRHSTAVGSDTHSAYRRCAALLSPQPMRTIASALEAFASAFEVLANAGSVS